MIADLARPGKTGLLHSSHRMSDDAKTLPRPTAPTGVRLTIISAQGTQTRPVDATKPFTLGRSRSADVTIDDPSISRVHARLVIGASGIELTDLSSSNGSRIGGRPAKANEPVAVGPGEMIEVGSVVLVVQRGAAEAEADRSVRLPVPRGRTVMDAVEEAGRKAALHRLNVLVTGETGVGKGVMARRIHALSPRAEGPFVVLDCTAIAPELADSELFGHVEGAFTSARAAKTGLLEAADGGTAFLDEIGELAAPIQAKLLRAIEERRIRRVGDVAEREIDVRFIAATNRDLEAEVAAGRFRRDLLYRLNAVTLPIPPLRERPDEVVLLAEQFLRELADDPPKLTPDATRWLRAHAWPGNVRELRNAIERAFVESEGGPIAPSHLQRLPASGASSPAPAAGPETDGERARIVAALEACAGNQTKAAAMLGISRRTLIYRLDHYGLPRPRKR